jgi:hypothetical protein
MEDAPLTFDCVLRPMFLPFPDDPFLQTLPDK